MKTEKEERLSWYPRFLNSKQYRDAKLRILREDMCINPTPDELDHLNSLKTENEIDRAIHSIMERHWREIWLIIFGR